MNARNPSLDLLRGIAVLLVIMSHYPYFGWMTAGWFGVDLFFVLSGFLISGLLFKEIQETGTIRIGRFLMRRGFKIYPSFYLFIATTAVLWPMLRSHIAIESVFLQNYFVVDGHQFPSRGWAHLWSLAVEEHFYLGLPLALLMLARFGKLRWIPKLSMWLLALCFAYRLTCVLARDPFSAVLYRTQSRIDALLIGVAISYLYRFERDRFYRISRSPWLFASLPLLFVPAFALSGTMSVLSLSTILLANALGFGLLLIFAVSSNLRFKPVAFVGQHSYSIYLWHVVPLAYFASKPVTAFRFGANMLLAVAMGIIMARIVEFPALKLRERLLRAPEKIVGRNNSVAVRTVSDADLIRSSSEVSC